MLHLFNNGVSGNFPTFTWATLPAASTVPGVRVHVSDVGEGGSDWKSNGTLWLPVNGSVLLARSAVAASVTGTLAETALATINVPAGIMGTNGQLRITTLWSFTNNANAKTQRVRLGGISGTAFLQASFANFATGNTCTHIRNRNSASAQIGWSVGNQNGFGVTTGGNVTAAIDFSVAVTIAMTAQLGVAGDSGTLESYTVELLR